MMTARRGLRFRTLLSPGSSNSWRVSAALTAAFWGAVAAHSVAWRYYVVLWRASGPSLGFIAAAEIVMFGIAALLTPAIFHVARRFPFERGGRLRAITVHFASAALFALMVKLCWDIAMWPLYRMPWITDFAWGKLGRSLFAGFQVNFLLYWVAMTGVLALDAARRHRDAATEAAELRAQLAEAKLATLRSQLDPHFLFNTLNGISALVHSDPDAADEMVSNLSELLRRSLDHAGDGAIPLSEEIDFVRLYLDIQCRRFDDRLKVRYEISEQAAFVKVPDMIVQPLVENAVRHAIAKRREGGRIEIRANICGGLCLEVEDFGGRPVQPPEVEGVGLRNTRQRLESVYGDAHKLELLPGSEGLLVRMSLPL